LRDCHCVKVGNSEKPSFFSKYINCLNIFNQKYVFSTTNLLAHNMIPLFFLCFLSTSPNMSSISIIINQLSNIMKILSLFIHIFWIMTSLGDFSIIMALRVP